MPNVKSHVKHDLGKVLAIKRMKEACEWAHSISDLHENWRDNLMEFTVSIQGVKISGTVEVADEALLFNGMLPLIALPFKSWIPNMLKNALKERPGANRQGILHSEEPLLFYLHVPKAGGTTLGEFIYNQCKNDDDADEGLIKHGVFFTPHGFFRSAATSDDSQFGEVLKRADLRAVIGHFAFGIHAEVNRPFRYVTVLRQPVSRVVSLYHYLKLEGRMSLYEFANTTNYREVDNDQVRRIAGVNPGINECTQAHLEQAKRNLRNHFAVAGVMERFDETLVLLQQKLGWSKKLASYPRNVNTDKTNASPAPETIALLESRNVFDAALYRYANELMDELIAQDEEQFYERLREQKARNA